MWRSWEPAIIQCPFNANGMYYGFKLSTHGTDVDSKWTLSQVKSKQEMKAKLKSLMIAYEDEQKLLNSSEKSTPAGESSQLEPPNTTPTTGNVASKAKQKKKGTEKETPQPTEEDRARAYAALKTACSSGGTTGSSNQSGKERRRSRQQAEENAESDTDDGADLNEFDDSFRAPMAEIVDSEDSGDEYETQATDATTIEDQESFGKIVQKLIWKFEEVEAGNVPYVETKPLLQGKAAQTTLRAGCSDCWSTPFECFQHLGCNKEFVALLTCTTV
ncbi:unknown protein [Seminavis robusta]|uniref:Uncharacterized protein n=1 Tax=Seminavis robusta TaxID=568900 RepID=A0A9N8HUC1_9STRA|nr:unknown protein [Seminavis robusta]|eukprot:Sro2036_g312090.1 n/a (274) ;mRNA; f:16052-16873